MVKKRENITAYLGIGSNLGNRKANIDNAVKLLGLVKGLKLLKASSIYETEPEGGPIQGKFLNGALEIKTTLSPSALLGELKKIERELGRKKTVRNGPRAIDLDILLFGNKKVNTRKLKIPHPMMHKREFVLRGLRELKRGHPAFFSKKKWNVPIINMQIMDKVDKMKTYARIMRKQNKLIGFIPTMGCLHEGHLSLMRAARKQSDVVIMSVFVNPIQFGPDEDFERYPRDIKKDEELAKSCGVDVMFCPDREEMYPADFSTYVNVEKLTDGLCAKSRTGHFRGVATVVLKLFEIVKPDIAYFGQKDAQQAFVIKKMIEDLNLDVTLKLLPTVRETDGLAMSSRNAYLTKPERKEALLLNKSLKLAEELINSGETDPKKVIEKMKDLLMGSPAIKIDYVAITDTKDLRDVSRINGEVLIAAALFLGKTRLIDNIIYGKRD